MFPTKQKSIIIKRIIKITTINISICCDVAVAQINYPSFKHNTQDSIEQARGRSHEEVQVRFLC
jgi:hypothetical protein